jgi:hypothetical protein
LEREYKIDAAARRCIKCERVFAVGDEYFSAVAETTEEDRFQRQEFCPACWNPGEGAYFSFWKTRVPEPDAEEHRGPRLIDMGRLLQLFEHLAAADDVQAQRFRYVLALVLMRKRRLKIVESRRLPGGRGEELTLREPGTERRHTVLCPNVTEEEIRSVADRLRDILDMPEKWDNVSTAEAEPVDPPTGPAAESAPEAAGDSDSAPDVGAGDDVSKAADGDPAKDGAADA